MVEAALQSLPKNLSGTYALILERIEAQIPYMRDLALNCLAWTIYAQRPLNAEELRHALAISLGCTDKEDIENHLPEVDAVGTIRDQTHEG